MKYNEIYGVSYATIILSKKKIILQRFINIFSLIYMTFYQPRLEFRYITWRFF